MDRKFGFGSQKSCLRDGSLFALKVISRIQSFQSVFDQALRSTIGF